LWKSLPAAPIMMTFVLFIMIEPRLRVRFET
jgi:hypothetical protein